MHGVNERLITFGFGPYRQRESGRPGAAAILALVSLLIAGAQAAEANPIRSATRGAQPSAVHLAEFVRDARARIATIRTSLSVFTAMQDRRHHFAIPRSFPTRRADLVGADPTSKATDADTAIPALVGDPEYGAYLSSECTTCHQAGGENVGIPSIVLWPEKDFVTVMHAYKRGAREHPVMNMVAARLTDEDIAALAAYFATLDP
ncbi:hypothetical protein R5H30_00390 [Sulfitobacter sp. D35]|uniref:c-type cytochrome n=1 Tax=Sulfitobacter sp. D35 TaxID=3083252 RepID=UPI00296FC35E|nr:c-type cytochrome [Sulfitobacter sp. D35]MDW4496421.1 hypothetical protein [Sulfitobacter sp. D35]